MDDRMPDRLLEAWNRHDARAFSALFASDAVFVDVGLGRRYSGVQAAQPMVFASNLSSNIELTPRSLLRQGDRFASEIVLTGTHDGGFAPFDIGPTGNRLTVRAAYFMQVAAGHVTSFHLYYDLAGFLTQLGVRQLPEIDWQLTAWADERPEPPIQPATEAPGSPDDDLDTAVDGVLDAWNRRDRDALVRLMADDATYEIVGSNQRFDAADAGRVIDNLEACSSDYQVERRNSVRQGGTIAVETRGVGVNDRPFTPFQRQASNRTYELREACFFTVEGGRIRSYTSYVNMVDFLRQIGSPQPGQVAWRLEAWSEETPGD